MFTSGTEIARSEREPLLMLGQLNGKNSDKVRRVLRAMDTVNWVKSSVPVMPRFVQELNQRSFATDLPA